MSLIANIDHLHVCSGIEAVSVVSPNQPRTFRGAEAWCPVLDTALRLFSMTSEQSIRMVVGSHTILIQRENQETVAVVLPTGHAIAKSLRRMIRRMARKDRAPLTQAQIAAKQAEINAAMYGQQQAYAQPRMPGQHDMAQGHGHNQMMPPQPGGHSAYVPQPLPHGGMSEFAPGGHNPQQEPAHQEQHGGYADPNRSGHSMSHQPQHHEGGNMHDPYGNHNAPSVPSSQPDSSPHSAASVGYEQQSASMPNVSSVPSQSGVEQANTAVPPRVESSHEQQSESSTENNVVPSSADNNILF